MACSSSINREKYRYQHTVSLPRLSLSTRDSHISLKYINTGAGTTGTRSIHSLFCNYLQLKALHFSDSCNSDASNRNKLLTWYNHLTKCAVNKKNQCTCDQALNSLTPRLDSILTTFEAISDTPVDMLFPEIYSSANTVSVVATLRDPIAWARRRLEQHPNTLICRPELWQASVLHPFDVVGCLQAKEQVEDALMTVFELVYRRPWLSSYDQSNVFARYGLPDPDKLSVLGDAFVWMNSVHADIVENRGGTIFWICLWDNHDNNLKDVSVGIQRHGANRMRPQWRTLSLSMNSSFLVDTPGELRFHLVDSSFSEPFTKFLHQDIEIMYILLLVVITVSIFLARKYS